MKKILISTGGSGGHVIPSLIIFDHLNNNFEFNSDVNIISININNKSEINVDEIIKKLKPYFKYLKLKSANLDDNLRSYIFWYNIEEDKIEKFLKDLKTISTNDVEISIYSKTGAYE